jgi:hypothetical protein
MFRIVFRYLFQDNLTLEINPPQMRILFFVVLNLSFIFCSAQQKDTVYQPIIIQDSSVVEHPEIPPCYPGGEMAWRRYLSKHPYDPNVENVKIYVTVKFMVDEHGIVSNIEAIKGPEKGGYRELAVQLINKSGRWTPAVEHGRQCKAYRLIDFEF